MQTINFDATEDLPQVIFDASRGYFEISKRSLPENAIHFYTPLFDYIQTYLKSPKEQSTLVFHFDYINTSSTKQILKLILLFDQDKTSKNTTLNWNYDRGDLDMLQTGKRLEKLTSLNFIYKEI